MNQNTAIAKQETGLRTVHEEFFSKEQWKLLTDHIMKDATPEEVTYFGEVCRRVGLDPFKKQIHAVKRWDNEKKRQVWSYQTGIDGYRSIAASCGNYAGSDEPVFMPADESTPNPRKATVTVWKIVGNIRVAFTASARWDEYVQLTRDGNPNAMWRKMPYGQLAKCFDEETEVLTSNGFKKFADVRPPDLIAAVDKDEKSIQFVFAPPFQQPYVGAMVSYKSDCIDFCVTPNHDMLTTVGKMEARAMLKLASSKTTLKVPTGIKRPASDPCSTLKDSDVITENKTLSQDFITKLTPSQAREILDSWEELYGCTIKETGTRRIYSSDPKRTAQIEILAVMAGYSISGRHEITSRLHIGDKLLTYFTISESSSVPVKRWIEKPKRPSLETTYYCGLVWCVTVPTGIIVVRRNGFSMLCGNCAESLALRKAWPERLSGLLTDVEMEQSDSESDRPGPQPSGRQAHFSMESQTFEPSASTAPTTAQNEEPPQAIEAEIIHEIIVPPGIARFTSGKWKEHFGDLRSKAMTDAREEAFANIEKEPVIAQQALASIVDEIRTRLISKGITESKFADLASDGKLIEWPADLWTDLSKYADLLNFCKTLR